MEPTFDIPDSTDWLETPLTLLAPFESFLRCQVCKDFFDNPVITSCSHTFCSLCIRRCLSTEGKCPACRSSDQELKLRRNWAVQELVEGFKNARPSILQLAKKASTGGDAGAAVASEEPALKKRKIEPNGNEVATDGPAEDGIRTRSRSRGVARQAPAAPIEIMDDVEDDEYIPEDGLVPCPICGRRMKEEAVFRHLDTCTGVAETSKPAAFGSLASGSRRPLPVPTGKPPERLPAINYSLLKDTMLRKKLKDLGIPNWGPRPLLQRRHTEWMNLWNANCDSRTPKPKRELLRELDIWERAQGGSSVTLTDTTSSVMNKDFNTGEWSANYDTDFKALIANARKRNDAAVRSTIPNASQDGSNASQNTQSIGQSSEATTSAQAVNEEGSTNIQNIVVNRTEVQAVTESPQALNEISAAVKLPSNIVTETAVQTTSSAHSDASIDLRNGPSSEAEVQRYLNDGNS
ncbi:E3 ubiquitin-protein ligase RAD18 [Aspergillus mulundensis]|uniref:Postreplication repair E3 ubiquitin-protein ligase RAD18 n=1 Tax=Aspergillus mulundensis TaxID=1810919 RepID=A0A3D8RYT1_9EURO|nr:Postreplication repair E3 ubiquitin-protein ligase rad18 [Aspergillus mulundensis]RDW79196.1 Postreplication repair E3 ubiquitin-protein ligase rad18 [Aspergillus mulundensis]